MTEILDDGEIIFEEKIKIDKNDNKSTLMIKMLPLYKKFTKLIIENFET